MIRKFWDELPEIITAIDQDALARVIVISSTGKHFSAGMDLSVFSQNNITSSEKENKKEEGRYRGSFYKKLFNKIKLLSGLIFFWLSSISRASSKFKLIIFEYANFIFSFRL